MASPEVVTQDVAPTVKRVRLCDPLAWHSSVPSNISEAASWNDGSRGWSAWVRHLRKRSWPERLLKLLPGRGSPFAWGTHYGGGTEPTARLLIELNRLEKGKSAVRQYATALLRAWLDVGNVPRGDLGFALECVAWPHGLIAAAPYVSASMWWEGLERLFHIAKRGAERDFADDPLIDQLLGGELPLEMGYLFPELQPCRALPRQARRVLSQGLVKLIDDTGLVSHEQLPRLRTYWACWTRCRTYGARLRQGCWNQAAERRFQRFIGQCIRLVRFDGQQPIYGDGAPEWSRPLFRRTMRQCSAPKVARAADQSIPRAKIEFPSRAKRKTPPASTHSDWGGIAVLRSAWRRSSPMLTVDFGQKQVGIELEQGREVIASGDWRLELTRDGQALSPTGAWQTNCWESDRDIDFLELEAPFGDGVCVQRQLLLAHRDRFLLLADCVLCEQPSRIDLRNSLPLREGIDVLASGETREVILRSRRNAATCLPLALPEWRSDPRIGTLEPVRRGLQLQQQERGRGMYAPLFLDLGGPRNSSSITWRQLTVAELRQPQPTDVAAGFRVQIGKRQWLIYRSLTGKANRTVLGQNLVTEFLAARFRRNGTTKDLLELA